MPPPPPEYRVRLILRRASRLEEEALRVQLRILRALRRDILARMLTGGAFDRWRLSQLLSAVDQEILAASQASQAALAKTMETAFGRGLEMIRLAVGGRSSLIGISRELVQAILSVTTDQIRQVWSELGSSLKIIIRRAATGVLDPYAAMARLARQIRDPKTFGRAFWRAEAIIRTEVGRTFSIAEHSGMDQAAAAGVKLRKYWLTADDERVRDEHRQAGEDYGRAEAIPWDQPFVVGGERLMFPRDPSGSAGNTIQCRCQSVPVVLEE